MYIYIICIIISYMDRALDLIHAAEMMEIMALSMRRRMDKVRRRMDRVQGPIHAALDPIHAANGPVYDKK